MKLKLTIEINRLTTEGAYFALGLAGLAESWEVGDVTDGNVLVVRNLDEKDVGYMPDMIRELMGQEIPFRLETENQ